MTARVELSDRLECQTACKPGSVRHCLRNPGTTIPLGRASLRASRDQPGRRGGNAPASTLTRTAGRPYSVLLPVGFTLPPLLPGARCALTAPFHPCLRGRSHAGGLFSVALSLRSPSPAVSRHRIPVEPGLSSSRVAPTSGRPAVWRAVHAPPGYARQPAPHSRATAASRAMVPASACPFTVSGRQWR
jgi:hypothetical protein